MMGPATPRQACRPDRVQIERFTVLLEEAGHGLGAPRDPDRRLPPAEIRCPASDEWIAALGQSAAEGDAVDGRPDLNADVDTVRKSMRLPRHFLRVTAGTKVESGTSEVQTPLDGAA